MLRDIDTGGTADSVRMHDRTASRCRPVRQYFDAIGEELVERSCSVDLLHVKIFGVEELVDLLGRHLRVVNLLVLDNVSGRRIDEKPRATLRLLRSGRHITNWRSGTTDHREGLRVLLVDDNEVDLVRRNLRDEHGALVMRLHDTLAVA